MPDMLTATIVREHARTTHTVIVSETVYAKHHKAHSDDYHHDACVDHDPYFLQWQDVQWHRDALSRYGSANHTMPFAEGIDCLPPALHADCANWPQYACGSCDPL